MCLHYFFARGWEEKTPQLRAGMGRLLLLRLLKESRVEEGLLHPLLTEQRVHWLRVVDARELESEEVKKRPSKC